MVLSRKQVEQVLEAMRREGIDEVMVEVDNNGQVNLKVPTVRTTYKKIPLTKRRQSAAV